MNEELKRKLEDLKTVHEKQEGPKAQVDLGPINLVFTFVFAITLLLYFSSY
jgi:hypothetical protein